MANKKFNTENLKPFDKMDKDKHRELSVRGAKASNKKRREKKLLKDSLLALLELNDDTGLNNQEKLIKALFEKACSGDVNAFNSLRDTIGQKPKDEVVNTNINPEPIQIICQPVKKV